MSIFFESGTRFVAASCQLNQWALDFDGNLDRIKKSIEQAKEKGATYRLGPELEIPGYSCEDHFLELDTFAHSEESLAKILDSDLTDNILCDIGCPILYEGVRYNCRVFCLNRQILLIRPKIYLADDGNYREKRFFSSWKDTEKLSDFTLSSTLSAATANNQSITKIGIGIIKTRETMIAAEICEELWTASSPHIGFALNGVEVIGNGSGSHFQSRKLQSRIDLISSATKKCGGCYLYSNLVGGDGTRLYFDGSSLISVNGQLVGQAPQFSLKEVDTVACMVDLSEIRSYRQAAASFQEQSSTTSKNSSNIVDVSYFKLCPESLQMMNNIETTKIKGDNVSHTEKEKTKNRMVTQVSQPVLSKVHTVEEECLYGPACWLWDYLRRSGAGGFLLPLSGGADSASVAAIVRIMCELVEEEIKSETKNDYDKSSAFYSRNVESTYLQLISSEYANSTSAKSDKESDILCNSILHTVYLGTDNSSIVTQDRANALAENINSFHRSIDISKPIEAVLKVFQTYFSKAPRFLAHGGSHNEDIALQNLQARMRMVFSYLCAQLFPWLRGSESNGKFLLVLGSGNVDEALRGYMTKYDCSSADLNPIGGISKTDLKSMLLWAAREKNLHSLTSIVNAKPSAELRPLESGKEEYTQTDDEDMGMTYDELSVFGKLRKESRCGPVSMFRQLIAIWKHISPTEVAEKVKKFFFYYGINRHKLTVLTPSFHAEGYSPDDNRYDLRPFLYNASWKRQFTIIDRFSKIFSSNSKRINNNNNNDINDNKN